MAFLFAHWPVISAILALLLSEALPYIKSTEANGIVQLAVGLLQKKPPTPPVTPADASSR